MEKTPDIPTQQNIKQMHLKEIFLQVLGSGGISRAQLRQSLGLSFPSVSALVDELLSQGILYEDGALAGSQRGRPRTQLRVEPRAFVVPVATLSAEGYRCVLFDCTGKPLSRAFLSLDNPQGIEAFSAPLKKWLDDLAEYSRMKALVLTVPGNFHFRDFLCFLCFFCFFVKRRFSWQTGSRCRGRQHRGRSRGHIAGS